MKIHLCLQVFVWTIIQFASHFFQITTKTIYSKYDEKKKKENWNLSYFSSRDRFESNCWLQDNLVKVIKNGNWIKPVEIVDGSILSFMAPFVLPSFLFIYRKPRSKKRTFTRMRPMKRATLLERKKYIYIYRRDRGIEI